MGMGPDDGIGAFTEEEIGPLPLRRIGRELILFTPVGKCDEKFRAARPTPGEDFLDVRGVEPVDVVGRRDGQAVGPIGEVGQGDAVAADIEDQRVVFVFFARGPVEAGERDAEAGIVDIRTVEPDPPSVAKVVGRP